MFKNVAISGDIGTGKSTLVRRLAEKLGWKYLHTGEFFRKWHKEHNVPLEASEKIPEELDKEIDMGYQEKMRTEENTIFESHLAGWLAHDVPGVFKVLCTTQYEVAMERAAKRDGVSIEEAKVKAKERADSLKEKFRRLYGVEDRFDPKYFDLIIDTTNVTPDQVLEMVLEKLGPSQ